MAPDDGQLDALIARWKHALTPCRRWHVEDIALWFLAVAMWAFAIGLHVARIILTGGHHA